VDSAYSKKILEGSQHFYKSIININFAKQKHMPVNTVRAQSSEFVFNQSFMGHGILLANFASRELCF
jgi:hypothetical protein